MPLIAKRAGAQVADPAERARAVQPGAAGGPPSIAVVVRTLGSARLADALASLAVQTRRDFEVVVVDMSAGPGRGATVSTVERWISLPRCSDAGGSPALRHLVIGRPLGRPAALNSGIAAARAPLIAILDDDNLYDPEHLERLVTGIDSTGADYVYTGVRHATYGPGGCIACRAVSIPFKLDRLILGNFIYATGSAYRRALWERLGGYDERFLVFEDWDFIIRAARAGALAHLPVVSGESRKFTGREGVSNFDLEIRQVRRCHAGIYWKHRRLYTGALRRELQIAAADHCRRRVSARPGLLARSVGGWRLELGRDLLAWWGGNLAKGRRARGMPRSTFEPSA